MNTTETFSQIITPPDVVDTSYATVLLIDPTQSEIEDIALYLNLSPYTFTIYVYAEAMNNDEWLSKVINKSTTVIVNVQNNSISGFKDKLVCSSDRIVHYYGEKNFLMNNKKLEKPIDYFIQYTK